MKLIRKEKQRKKPWSIGLSVFLIYFLNKRTVRWEYINYKNKRAILTTAEKGEHRPSNWRGVTSNSCHHILSPSDGSFTFRNFAARKIAPAATWWGLNCKQSEVRSLHTFPNQEDTIGKGHECTTYKKTTEHTHHWQNSKQLVQGHSEQP